MLAILGSTLISEDYFMNWTQQKSTHIFLQRKICSQIYIISTEMRSQKYIYEQYYLIQITLKLTVWKAMDHKNTKKPNILIPLDSKKAAHLWKRRSYHRNHHIYRFHLHFPLNQYFFYNSGDILERRYYNGDSIPLKQT